MKKRLSLVFILLSLLLTACSKDDKNTTTLAFQGEYVVSASYVAKKINDENIILVHVKDDKSTNKTIDNSLSMDYDYLTEKNTSDEGETIVEDIVDKKELSSKLGNLGLDKNKEIILFSDTNNGLDGKVLYQLLNAGYDYVKIVDGGYNSLIEAGLENGQHKTPTSVKVNISELDKSRVISKKELEENYDDLVIVTLDEKNLSDDLKDSIKLNYYDLFNKNNTLKTMKEIKEIFKKAGLKTSNKIVLYSNDGIKSAYSQVIFDMCGYKSARRYEFNQSISDETAEKDVTELEENEDTLENASTSRPNSNTTTSSNSSISRPNSNTTTSNNSSISRPSSNTTTSNNSSTSRPNSNTTTSRPDNNSSGSNNSTNSGSSSNSSESSNNTNSGSNDNSSGSNNTSSGSSNNSSGSNNDTSSGSDSNSGSNNDTVVESSNE